MTPDSAQRGPAGERWWLDPRLAELAFGSRHARPATDSGESTLHLAFLPTDALELDLSDPAQCEFGDYQLREQIGQGGMGVVYRAWQKSLEREVALKLLSAGPWASEEFVAGFRREARNAASLQHPNIVAVYEMAEQDGLIYYAMQLIRGRSLAQCLRERRTLPPREAAALLRTVAEAVDYAHRLGVLHLDLKPGNILLDEAGTALVTDFGLARRLGQAPSVENEQISGTPSYMAPEQAQVRSSRLSAATDIWGIGAILYETLSGVPPFVGDDPQEILRRVLSGRVRRLSRHGPVPPDLEAICLKCLRKAPQERYASARELADDLGRFLEHRSVHARPLNALQRMARWARREPRFALASGLAVTALVAGLATTTQQWRRAEGHALTASERLWEGRRESALQFEAEGKGWQALARLLENVREQDATGHHDAAGLDRRRIGLLLGQGATLIDATLVADANPLALALSEDGSRLALAFGDQSVRWYETGTLEELGRIDLGGRISSGGQARSTILLRFVDNRRLRATREWYRQSVNPTDGDTWLLDLDRAEVVEPPDAFADFSDGNFSHDARLALLRDRGGRLQSWATAPWRPLSEPAARTPTPSAAPPWLIAPDGRHALTLDADMRTLHLYRLPQLQRLRTLTPAGDAAISAWAFGDGHRAALGDTEGRIFLLVPETGELRMLPAARGREVTWLEFSADGSWLAAGGADGRVHAFDADSGDPLVSGSMEHDFPVRRVGIDRARRLLLVAGDGETALWRLPAEGGPRALPAIRIGAPPSGHAQAGPHAVDWSVRSGLLASAGIDGQVRLWRLPAAPTSAAIAPRQFPETLHFHGRHVVDVEWDRLRLLSVDGAAASDWLALPRPPGFAELSADGRTLLVTVGPELRVYDVPSLRERFPPIALPQSPQRLLLDRDGRRLLLAFGARHPQGFGERLRSYDLAAGRADPDERIVQGPLLMLAFSPDGGRIVAVGPAEAGTAVLNAATLEVIGQYPHDPFQPVVTADFAIGDDTVWLLARAEDPRLGTDELLRWDPDSDAIVARQAVGQARPFAVVALADGAFVAGETAHLVIDRERTRTVNRPTTAYDALLGAHAVSPDRSLIALGARHGVELYTADGVRLGAPLRIDTPPTDGIVHLAFSADGEQLLARTVFRFARWPIAPERRGHDALDALLAWLGADARVPRELHIPSARLRAALRASDPGGWTDPEPRPGIALAGHAGAGRSPVPARAPDAPARTLDLTPVYSVGPEETRNSAVGLRPFLRPYPAGLQRIGGIDFDLRGMAEFGPDGLPQCVETPPEQPAGAVHALLLPMLRTAEEQPRLLAELVFRYGDGGLARVPIRSTLEVHGYGGRDHAVPLAFAVRTPLAAMGFRTSTLAAPRLPNPHPERPLHCIDLHTTGERMLLLGLTLEP